MTSQTYIVIASRTSNPNESLSSPETLSDYHRHEFATFEQAEAAASELQADAHEYGLDDVTYEVAVADMPRHADWLAAERAGVPWQGCAGCYAYPCQCAAQGG